ncbi:MAG: Holliday junction resolvase RuvX [Patescibacteria group bacterium]|jgi:putative Holliday junction resolvase
MKCLALDYGKARVGLALGDSDTKVAVGKGVLKSLSQNKVIEKIKAIVNLDHIDRVIVGLPVNLHGEATEMTIEVQRFIEKLRNHISVPVQTFDERYTSAMADRLLAGQTVPPGKQDEVAAQIILQNYLDSLVV